MFFEKKFDFIKEFKQYEFKEDISFEFRGIHFETQSQKLTWTKAGRKYYLFWGTKFIDDSSFRGIGWMTDSLILSFRDNKMKFDSLGPYISPEAFDKVYLDSKAKDSRVTRELQEYIWEIMVEYTNQLNYFENNQETKLKQALDDLLK